jgi:hypothetical protein
MSLGKLLTTGKSLMAGHGPSRYQMHKHIRLPNFGAARNPFAPEARPEAPSAPLVVAPPVTSAPAVRLEPVLERRDQAADNVAGCALPPQGNVPVPAKRGARLAVVGRAMRGLGAQWGKVNPFAGRTKDSGPVRAGLPQPGGVPPVQGELSLEKVRVVRNDLSDADLEIIPAAVPVAPAEPPPLVAAIAKHGPEANAWSRLTTRFFGAGAPS